MMIAQNMNIKGKLITIVMVTCLVALILVGGAFVVLEVKSRINNMIEDLHTKAQITAYNCEGSISFEDPKDAEKVLKGLKADPYILYACVYKKNGEVFANYAVNEADKTRLAIENQPPGHILSWTTLTVFESIYQDKEVIGSVCLRSDLSPLYSALKRNAANTIIVLILAALAAYLISSWLQKIISTPILNLAKVARKVSEQKDYSTRAVKTSNDEIGLLIDSFNEMLQQIQHRDLELVKARDDLEVRVRERTAELTRTNEQLKEEEVKQAQLLKELESVNQELKDFAYIASHDLKAPLRAIKTLADWIIADYADKLDQDGQEQLKLLMQRVDRMHNLIDGILQYSRVGRVREKITEIELNKLLPEIIDMLAPPPHIKIKVVSDLPVVRCEETRITQVFQNLLSNAVKYMDKPEGLIQVGCVEEGEFWKFYVSDNGPGIERQHWERIFKIFQTLAPRDEFESTGIGLTVVKKIVEMYGGKIWLESEVGKGTTFFWTFPRAGVEDLSEEAQTVSVATTDDSNDNGTAKDTGNT